MPIRRVEVGVFRRLLSGTVTLLLLLLACGCARVAPSQLQEEGVETIKFMVEMPDVERYQVLAEQFREVYPNLVIEVEGVDYHAYDASEPPLIAMAHASDCFIGYAHILDETTLQAVAELSSLLDLEPLIATDDFYPSVLSLFTAEGGQLLYGVPADVIPLVIEYNKGLFDAAELDYPSPGWSWDDFLDMAIALTNRELGVARYGYLPSHGEKTTMLLILEHMGAGLAVDQSGSWRVAFDDPATAEAIRWYADLTARYDVKPLQVEDDIRGMGLIASRWSSDQHRMVAENRAAMWTSAFWPAVYYTSLPFEVGFAPLPGGSVDAASYSWPRGYFISSQTTHAQACWQWVAFLAAQPPADIYRFPANRLVAESRAYAGLAGEERVAAYWSTVAGAGQPSFTVSTPLWVRAGASGLFLYGDVLSGLVDLGAEMDEAQARADSYCACMEERLQDGGLAFRQKFIPSPTGQVPVPVPTNAFLAFDEPVACFHQAAPGLTEPVEAWGPYYPRRNQ